MSKITIPPFDPEEKRGTDEPFDGTLPSEADVVRELMTDTAEPEEEPEIQAELAALDGADDSDLLDEYEDEVEELDGDGEEEYDEEDGGEETPLSTPVNMTKEEYVAMFTAFQKVLGSLRTFSMMLVMFIVYIVIIGGSTIAMFVQMGQWDPLMLLLNVVTLATGAVTLGVVRRRVTKNAVQTYEAGDIDGYYGEITVTPQYIEKKVYDGAVRIPFDERTVYIEDTCGMQFVSQGVSRGIVIPARCATEALSAEIRRAVFAPNCRVRRRVIKRMPSLAAEPIPRQALKEVPPTLQEVAVRYEPEEIRKIVTDAGWKNYVSSLPILGSFALLCGTLTAMMEESIPVFFVTVVGIMLALLLLSMFSARNKANAAVYAPNALTMRVILNRYGVAVEAQATADTPTNRVLTRWQTLTRAVERADCVELIGAGRMIRIPKRCILDLDGFRQTVDAHYPPKA